MYYLYAKYECEQVREPDPNDEWDAGDDGYFDHEFLITETKLPENLRARQGAVFELQFNANKNEVLVCVIYTTGCTFGSSAGRYGFLGPMHPETAKNLKEAIDRVTDSGRMLEELKRLRIDGYPFWMGYFESLERVLVLNVGDSSWQN